jgi:hypothetical protein
MEAFLVTFTIVVLFAIAGVIISVHLHLLDPRGTGRFRWVRRVRTLPGGTMTEEVIEKEEFVGEEV